MREIALVHVCTSHRFCATYEVAVLLVQRVQTVLV